MPPEMTGAACVLRASSWFKNEYCPDTTNSASKIPLKHPVNSVVVTRTSGWRGGNFAGDW